MNGVPPLDPVTIGEVMNDLGAFLADPEQFTPSRRRRLARGLGGLVVGCATVVVVLAIAIGFAAIAGFAR